jgi:hypothetical protein
MDLSSAVTGGSGRAVGMGLSSLPIVPTQDDAISA